MGILMGINFQYPNFKVCSEFLKAFSGKKADLHTFCTCRICFFHCFPCEFAIFVIFSFSSFHFFARNPQAEPRKDASRSRVI